MGIFAEMITNNEKVKKKIVDSKIFKILFYISIPMLLLIIASGGLWINELGKASLIYALYSAVVKKLWGFFNAVLIIGCTEPSEKI